MSHRSFSPCSSSGTYYSAFDNRSHGMPGLSVSHPHMNSSFAELQAFCNMARESTSPAGYPLDYPEQQYESANIHPWKDYRSPVNWQEVVDADSYHNASSFSVEDDISQYVDDDEGAEWFDLEGLGLDPPTWKFEFPVPTEHVLPVANLRTSVFNGMNFFVDEHGYVQVYTQGECRVPFTGKAAIGVWFGPDHPANVSECLYRGRRTQEAARFAAVIEAIKVAGSCGITKLQINTDYINVIRFMIYFILKWEGNGWMTVRGTPVKNQVLIQELDYFSRLLDVKWNYVPYETGAEGNLGALVLVHEALDLLLPSYKPTNRNPNPTGEETPTPTNVPAFEMQDMQSDCRV